METIHFPDDARPSWLVHPVLALGNFDGLHRGHLKIIERVKRGAAEHGGTPMAMTFDPHPPRVVRPDKAPPLLMTLDQRLEGLARAGITCTAVVRFTPELSQWQPETFVQHVLVDWLRVAEVWVGANFLFGRDRAGNFSLLRALGSAYGFKAEKIGVYEARCAELCGLEHAHMTGYVRVVTPSEYQSFLAAHTGASKALGKEIFGGVCATCHGLAGQGDYGPPLQGNAVVANPDQLETLLREGKNKMPAVGSTWDQDTMDAATSYMKERFGGG